MTDPLRVEGGDRPWTYCRDALPAEVGRYEVATVGKWLAADPLRPLRGARIQVADWIDLEPHDRSGKPTGPLFDWINAEGDTRHLIAVYAWRPITEDPPPLRPKDHAYLIEQGVPSEWVEEAPDAD